MNQLLTVGETVTTSQDGTPCRVEEYLGGGGQGEVYRVTMSGGQYALKWYFPNQATQRQRDGLTTIINRGAPHEKFLWPQALAQSDQHPNTFGYLMKLRDGQRYKSIIDLMFRRLNPEPDFRIKSTVGMELAHCFRLLHAEGMCYCDISFGNVFFDPTTGDVLICDNDNVTFDNNAGSGVYGTPNFMAPEIVLGEGLPCTNTDLYSLAVLLFYILLVAHPLDGAREVSIHCLDLPARNRLYGESPLFIFDPNDDSNRPVPGVHGNAIQIWPLLPASLQRLFTRSFTVGLRDAMNGRVRESEWRQAMLALRDSIYYCQCQAEAFFDPEALTEGGADRRACWHCGQPLRMPPRIKIGSYTVMLNHNTVLYPHHIYAPPHRQWDFSEPVAAVTQHPSNPSLWGLRNDSDETWTATVQDGQPVEVPPGRNVRLALGTTIDFGQTRGQIIS